MAHPSPRLSLKYRPQPNPKSDPPKERNMIIQVGETDKLIDCYEAITPEEQAQGLTQVSGLPLSPDGLPTGLLFFYDDEDDRTFWMHPQMRFAIDMVFIGANGVVREVYPNCQPGETDPKSPGQLMQFKAPAKWVLEVPVGVAAHMGIMPKVQINFDDDEDAGVV
jgi:uncharacterized membrane protein (UPF0127 family)